MMNIRQELHDYIVHNILFGDGEKLKDDASFQKTGILDSTGFLELITFIEERFEIQVADSDVIPENFDTLRQMSAFVERKLGVAAAA
jgi:acyl carrier protein